MGRDGAVTVSILTLARDDLREIWEHLSDFGENPPRKFRASFERFLRQVADMPESYSRYEPAPDYRRAVLVYGYLVFYQAEQGDGVVRVCRVLHGKRNIVPLLEEPDSEA